MSSSLFYTDRCRLTHGLVTACHVVAAVLSFAGSVVAAQTPARSPACHWSPPQLLAKDSTGAFEVTFPVLAATRTGELFIAGQGPEIWTDSGAHLDVPFVAYRIDRRGVRTRLPVPAFNGTFAYPRIAMANDTMHLFWGESDSSATPPPKPPAKYFSGAMSSSVKAIWTSTYTGSWSTPRHIDATFSIINWYNLQQWSSDARMSTVRIPVDGSPAQRFMVQWIELTGPAAIPAIDMGDTPPLYPTLVVATPSRLVFGFIMNDTQNAEHTNGVYAVWSADSGRTLSAPIQIASSGEGGAREITMIQSSDGLVHAVWGVMPGKVAFGAQGLGYAVSRDTGKTWSTPTYLDPRQGAHHLQIAADRDNRIHLVYQALLPGTTEPTPALFYTVRSATVAWKTPVLILGDTVADRLPVLTTTNQGDLVLLLSQRLGMRGKFPLFASAISYLHPGKDCMPVP